MSALDQPVAGVTLFAMTEKGYRVLSSLSEGHLKLIKQVVVAGDESVLQDYQAEIVACCRDRNIDVVKREEFDGVATEYAMAISWRWLIRHPKDRVVVFHDSLLPRYRGFAPLVNSLINGEPEIGVSAIWGDEEYDSGAIIAQSAALIKYPIKIKDAISIVCGCYAKCAETVFDAIASKQEIVAIDQAENEATYSVWRDELDYAIDWRQSSAYIRRFIDAVGFPYKGAYTLLDGLVVRVHSAVEVPDRVVENRCPGKVLFLSEGKPVVICGEGMLRVDEAIIESNEGPKALSELGRFRMRFC
jgi:methionyl-tRNA formyltransferase